MDEAIQEGFQEKVAFESFLPQVSLFCSSYAEVEVG